MDGQLSPRFRIRSHVETKEFEEAKSKLSVTLEQFDRVLSAAGISICRNPERYPIVVEQTGLRVVVTEPISTMPRFRMYYTFDEDSVYLLYVEEIPDEEF